MHGISLAPLESEDQIYMDSSDFSSVSNLITAAQSGHLNGWHWLILGLLCLLLSRWVLTVSLSALAVAALAVALLLSFYPVPPKFQIVVAMAVLPVAFLFIWWRGRVARPANATRRIRRRKSQLIGLRMSVAKRLGTGRGKAQLNDAVWTILSGEDFKEGDIVEVSGYTGDMLQVRPLKDSEFR